MIRNRIFASLLTALVIASPALAQSGLWGDLYRGLDVLATPSGSPILPTADGTRINGQRSGRLRIVPEGFGDGFNLEFDRSFGVDSRGRPEVLDLGPLEVQLAGAVQTTAGFTRNAFLVGNLNSSINNLAYAFSAKTGAQDAVLSGTLNGNTNVEINQFGFYTINMVLNNSGSQLTLDGVLANTSESTDFDLGPIAIEGNVFFDGFVALLTSFGADTTALQQLSPDSPIDRIADAIEQQMQLNEVVAGVSFERDALSLTSGSTAGELLSASAKTNGSAVPEPSALMLIAVGVGVMLRRRGR